MYLISPICSIETGSKKKSKMIHRNTHEEASREAQREHTKNIEKTQIKKPKKHRDNK
jgi:hypothetical protein